MEIAQGQRQIMIPLLWVSHDIGDFLSLAVQDRQRHANRCASQGKACLRSRIRLYQTSCFCCRCYRQDDLRLWRYLIMQIGKLQRFIAVAKLGGIEHIADANHFFSGSIKDKLLIKPFFFG